MADKPLLEVWWDRIQEDKYQWLGFYHEFLKSSISNTSRFFEAVEKYGDFPVFEAVIATSQRPIDGDPLNYLLAVAYNKAMENIQNKKDEESYRRGLERTKRQSYEKSLELADKIRRAEEMNG